MLNKIMLGKKFIIPMFILSLLFMVWVIDKGETSKTSLQLSQSSAETEVVSGQAVESNGTVGGSADSEAIIQPPSGQASSSDTSKTSTTVSTPPATSEVKSSSTSSKSTPTATASTQSTPTVSRGGSGTASANRVISMVATAYDGCYECNKPYYGYPSYIGLPLARGIVAVDPNVIPMGTKLYVEGYGEAIAADQGNAIKGNRIDLFFDSHQEALDYGMKTVKVTILSN